MYVNNLNKLATLIEGNVLFTTVNGAPFSKVFATQEEAVRWANSTKTTIKVNIPYRNAKGDKVANWVEKTVGFDVFIVGTREDARLIEGGFVKGVQPEHVKGAYSYVVTAVNNARNHKDKQCRACKGTSFHESGEPCPNCLGIGFMFGQKHKPKKQAPKAEPKQAKVYACSKCKDTGEIEEIWQEMAMPRPCECRMDEPKAEPCKDIEVWLPIEEAMATDEGVFARVAQAVRNLAQWICSPLRRFARN